MRRFAALTVCTLLLFVSASAHAGIADDANAVLDRWANAFSAGDADALVKLYAPDAIVLGAARPGLHRGTLAIREYYRAAPGLGSKVTIGQRDTVALGDGAVMSVGLFRFDLRDNGRIVPRLVRFTFIFVRRGDAWLIAHEHSSIQPPAPLK